MDDYSSNYLKSISKEKAMSILSLYYDIDVDGTVEDALKNIAFENKKNNSDSDFDKKGNETCFKCKSGNVIVREMQLRHSDEGSTLIIICNVCGYRNSK